MIRQIAGQGGDDRRTDRQTLNEFGRKARRGDLVRTAQQHGEVGAGDTRHGGGLRHRAVGRDRGRDGRQTIGLQIFSGRTIDVEVQAFAVRIDGRHRPQQRAQQVLAARCSSIDKRQPLAVAPLPHGRRLDVQRRGHPHHRQAGPGVVVLKPAADGDDAVQPGDQNPHGQLGLPEVGRGGEAQRRGRRIPFHRIEDQRHARPAAPAAKLQDIRRVAAVEDHGSGPGLQTRQPVTAFRAHGDIAGQAQQVGQMLGVPLGRRGQKDAVTDRMNGIVRSLLPRQDQYLIARSHQTLRIAEDAPRRSPAFGKGEGADIDDERPCGVKGLGRGHVHLAARPGTSLFSTRRTRPRS